MSPGCAGSSAGSSIQSGGSARGAGRVDGRGEAIGEVRGEAHPHAHHGGLRRAEGLREADCIGQHGLGPAGRLGERKDALLQVDEHEGGRARVEGERLVGHGGFLEIASGLASAESDFQSMRMASQKSTPTGSPPGRSRAAAAPEPAARQRRARGHLRAEALLESAAAVFARKGYEAATMTEIAAQADSAIGSLYQFFRTKEAVAAAVLDAQLAELWQRLDAVAGRAPALQTAELAAALAGLFVAFRAAHPSFERLVEAPGAPQDVVGDACRRVRERVRYILERHAPGADRALLRALAPVVQHVMKAAVRLNADLRGAERAAALRELEAMLAVHLAARLADRGARARGAARRP
jgi:AcrR family transcriptional regulator